MLLDICNNQKGITMLLRLILLYSTLSSALFFITLRADDLQDVSDLKRKILTLANRYSGQGDPSGEIQRTIEPYVNKLIALCPQAPVAKRLPLLRGTWKQVWGPYDYRRDGRGVDPTLDTKNIYQVIFAEGFYYNVTKLTLKNRKTSKSNPIGLLKGRYRLVNDQPNSLQVRFIKYPAITKVPQGTSWWDLPALLENGIITADFNVVPQLIVKLFFGGGFLREVYTDKDLRILYSDNDKQFKQPYLYVMARI